MRARTDHSLNTSVQLTEMPEQLPQFIDTHAHIHFSNFNGEVNRILHRANEVGIAKIVTVGVNSQDSRKAMQMAQVYENVWATVGIHPHEAGEADQAIGYIRDLASQRKVVAIGECGLDFFKSEASPAEQERALRSQVELAIELDLPLVFHVREAFPRFLAIMDDYPAARGIVHCFTAGIREMEQVLERGYLVALNGIVTFAKDEAQLEAARRLPLDRLVLETDCPFLSPAPYRGKQNEPARVVDIAKFLSELRREPVAVIAQATTANAETLFGI
jgi:TatD DNase family protein